MTILLGNSFKDELVAAGLPIGETGIVGWNTDGIVWGRTNLSAAQNLLLDQVIAAHDPSKPAAPRPQIISDRQFYQQAAIQGLCTTSEALAAVQIGSLPSSLSPLVNALPADQQFGAKMLLCGNVTFVRTHPLVIQLGQAFFGVDKAATALDALWAAAALL